MGEWESRQHGEGKNGTGEEREGKGEFMVSWRGGNVRLGGQWRGGGEDKEGRGGQREKGGGRGRRGGSGMVRGISGNKKEESGTRIALMILYTEVCGTRGGGMLR